MVTALALDPGRTTGFAVGNIDMQVCEVSYFQDKMDHSELYNFLGRGFYDHIICETFKFRQGKTGVDLYPCELIGVVHLWDQRNDGDSTLTMQEPWVQSGKKVFFSDTRLKDMGLYIKAIEHGRSAVKHLLYWFQFGAGSQYNEGQKIQLR